MLHPPSRLQAELKAPSICSQALSIVLVFVLPVEYGECSREADEKRDARRMSLWPIQVSATARATEHQQLPLHRLQTRWLQQFFFPPFLHHSGKRVTAPQDPRSIPGPTVFRNVRELELQSSGWVKKTAYIQVRSTLLAGRAPWLRSPPTGYVPIRQSRQSLDR
jgi:hypothetical protein